MIVNRYGRVGGSINLAQLAELHAQTDDDELKIHYRQVAAEHGVELEESAKPEPEAESEPEPEVETEPKPSMALSKDELVNLAVAAGLGERGDMEQFTKQELVDELKANESEG